MISQHVTIADGDSKVGDNVLFGAGSVLLTARQVGYNVKTGVNCVVVEGIP